MRSEARLGAAVRALRKQNDWTLAEVSAKTGISTSTLSKVERNQLSLTYDKLVQLSEGLGIDISVLFAGGPSEASFASPGGRRSINRRDDGRVIETQQYHHVYLNSDLVNRRMVPILAELKARTLEEFGDLIRHPGEEVTYVLEGEVEVLTEHYAPVLLKAGESIYLDSTMGHAYLARGSGRCRILSISAGPEASVIGAFKPMRIAAAASRRPVARKKKAPARRGKSG